MFKQETSFTAALTVAVIVFLFAPALSQAQNTNYNSLASDWLDKGNYYEAYKNANMARQEAIYSNDQEALALACKLIGTSFYLLSDYKSSLNYYKQALMIYEALNDVHNQARLIAHIANVYSELSDFQKAIEFEMKAIELVTNAGLADEFHWLHVNLAYDIGRNQEYKHSINKYLDIKPIFEERQDYKHLNYLLLQLAEIYRRDNQLENAEKALQQAIEVAKNEQNKSLLYSSYLELSILRNRQNQFSKAVELSQEALNYFKTNDRKSQMIKAYENLFVAFRKLEEYKKAFEVLEIKLGLEDEIETLKAKQYSEIFAIEKQVEKQKDAIRAVESQKSKLAENYESQLKLYLIIVSILVATNLTLLIIIRRLYKKSRK